MSSNSGEKKDERFTFIPSEKIVKEIDGFVERGRFTTRSEALRYFLWKGIQAEKKTGGCMT